MSFSLVLNNNNEYFILPDIAYKKKCIQIIDTIARSGFFFVLVAAEQGEPEKLLVKNCLNQAPKCHNIQQPRTNKKLAQEGDSNRGSVGDQDGGGGRRAHT